MPTTGTNQAYFQQQLEKHCNSPTSNLMKCMFYTGELIRPFTKNQKLDQKTCTLLTNFTNLLLQLINSSHGKELESENSKKLLAKLVDFIKINPPIKVEAEFDCLRNFTINVGDLCASIFAQTDNLHHPGDKLMRSMLAQFLPALPEQLHPEQLQCLLYQHIIPYDKFDYDAVAEPFIKLNISRANCEKLLSLADISTETIGTTIELLQLTTPTTLPSNETITSMHGFNVTITPNTETIITPSFYPELAAAYGLGLGHTLIHLSLNHPLYQFCKNKGYMDSKAKQLLFHGLTMLIHSSYAIALPLVLHSLAEANQREDEPSNSLAETLLYQVVPSVALNMILSSAYQFTRYINYFRDRPVVAAIAEAIPPMSAVCNVVSKPVQTSCYMFGALTPLAAKAAYSWCKTKFWREAARPVTNQASRPVEMQEFIPIVASLYPSLNGK